MSYGLNMSYVILYASSLHAAASEPVDRRGCTLTNKNTDRLLFIHSAVCFYSVLFIFRLFFFLFFTHDGKNLRVQNNVSLRKQ